LKNVNVDLSRYGFVKDVKEVWYRIENVPEGIKIKGDLDIEGTNVKSLPGIECDKIYAGDSKLDNISKDLKCKTLDIEKTPLSKKIGKDKLSQKDIIRYGV